MATRSARQVPPKPALDLTATLTQRGSEYGRFADLAVVSQDLKRVIEHHLDERGKVLEADQQEALDVICSKIARIINGNPDNHDSWHDIAGYADLVARRLNGENL